jgi:hypothetical protein
MRARPRRRLVAVFSVVGLTCAAMVATMSPSPAGALPVTFGATPLAGDMVDGEGLAVLQVGSTVFVGGNFTTVRNQAGATVAPRANLAAFDIATGHVVAGFRADTNGPVRALATDGSRLFVGGSFTTLNGITRNRVAAVSTATGAVDLGFRAETNSNVYGLARYQDRLVIGGSFSAVAGQPRSRFAVVSSVTGAVQPIVATFNATVATVGATSNGSRLFVGGAFTTTNGVAQRWAAVLDGSTGALAPVQLQHVTGGLSAISVAPDDATLVTSMTGAGNSGNRFDIATGRRQWFQTCDGDGQAIDEYAGTVYSGFHEGCAGDLTIRLTANDSMTGIRDMSFRPAFDRFWGMRSIDAGPAALAVAGDFTSISGVPAQGFAIFPTTGTPLPTTTTSTSTSTTSVPTTTIAPATTTTAPPSTNAGFPFALHDVWSYNDGTTTPASSWTTVGYADGSWPKGAGQLGYGDGDEATVLGFGPDPKNKVVTSYFRKRFSLAAIPGGLKLQLVADDGAVVYLNGLEVLRDNMPAGAVAPNTFAAANRGGANESNPRTFTIPSTALRLGDNVVAVEVHQDAVNTSDMSFDLAIGPA